MKKLFPFFFVASAVLNAAFVSFFFASSKSDSLPSQVKTVQTSKVPSETPLPKINEEVWPSLRSDDLPQLVEQLRAAGFPTNIIRAIVGAQLGEIFVARRKEIDPEVDTRPFWKQPPSDRRAAIAKLSNEHAKIVRDLLGAEDSGLNAVYPNRSLVGLPPEKVEPVGRLIREFDEKRSNLYRNGPLLPADREKIGALERDQRAALTQILSPAELEDYDLRVSNTASFLRSELSAFDPTEEEFRTMFRLRQPFDNQYNPTMGTGPLSPDQQRQRDEAQKQLAEQIKAALGPERAAEYERAKDYNYRQTSQLVARLELPAETTNQIWTVQNDIQKRSAAIRTNRELPAEERTIQLAELADEATTKITATLGDRGFEAYKQYGGKWMQQLQPRPLDAAPQKSK